MGKQKVVYRDPRGPHVRLYVDDLLDSHAWAVLSLSARILYAEFRASLGKSNNGDLSCPMSMASKRGAFRSPTTLAAALFELRALGFIVATRNGGVVAGSKLPTLYRFTDEPFAQFTKEGFKFGPGPATFDYAQHKTVDDARIALKTGVAKLHAEASKRNESNRKQKKSTLHILERDAPDSERKAPAIAPDFVQPRTSVAPDSGVLLQLWSGGVKSPAPVKPKRGRKREPTTEIHGETLQRVPCAVDKCPDPKCSAVLGEFHAAGCRFEVCPACGSASRHACKCSGNLRWLGISARKAAAR